MHLIYCISAALIVMFIGCFLLIKYSSMRDPYDEEAEEDFDEKVITMDNLPDWKQDLMKRVN